MATAMATAMALTVAPRARQGSAWGAARRGRCHAPESGLLPGLPCGATLSSPPSLAPHRYTCHPAHKTSPDFPSPALSRPAGRWPGPALPALPRRLLPPPCRGSGSRCCTPIPRHAPERRLPSEFRQVPRRALSRAHTAKPRSILIAAASFPKEATPASHLGHL